MRRWVASGPGMFSCFTGLASRIRSHNKLVGSSSTIRLPGLCQHLRCGAEVFERFGAKPVDRLRNTSCPGLWRRMFLTHLGLIRDRKNSALHVVLCTHNIHPQIRRSRGSFQTPGTPKPGCVYSVATITLMAPSTSSIRPNPRQMPLQPSSPGRGTAPSRR